MPLAERPREVEVDVHVIERSREPSAACLRRGKPEDRADGARERSSDEISASSSLRDRCAEAGHGFEVGGMLARAAMDRDAAHWAAVEDAIELLHEERYKEALEALREVIRADPGNPYAFFFLGQAFYEAGELQPSRDAYRAALKLAPQHLGARVALTHVLRKLGETRDAVKEGLIAVEQAPTDGEVLYALGLAYLARADNVSARRYLEAFLRAKPELETRLEVEALLQTMDGGPGPSNDDD
jgi:tetratricopeptide (TPR) repeat protein